MNAGLFLGRRIPEARTFSLGENLSASPNGYTHVYFATFDDRDAFAAFQSSPVHATRGPFVEALERLMVLDVDTSTPWRTTTAATPKRVVAFSFKPDRSPGDVSATLTQLARAAAVPGATWVAAGPNLAFSPRSMGHTHLQVATFGERAALDRFHADLTLRGYASASLGGHAAVITELMLAE